jgi:hypothetical protein
VCYRDLNPQIGVTFAHGAVIIQDESTLTGIRNIFNKSFGMFWQKIMICVLLLHKPNHDLLQSNMYKGVCCVDRVAVVLSFLLLGTCLLFVFP